VATERRLLRLAGIVLPGAGSTSRGLFAASDASAESHRQPAGVAGQGDKVGQTMSSEATDNPLPLLRFQFFDHTGIMRFITWNDDQTCNRAGRGRALAPHGLLRKPPALAVGKFTIPCYRFVKGRSI
jgi:hypothetical protein